MADLHRLEHIREVLADHVWETGDADLAIFGLRGFTDDLSAAAAAHGRAYLFDLNALYGRRSFVPRPEFAAMSRSAPAVDAAMLRADQAVALDQELGNPYERE